MLLFSCSELRFWWSLINNKLEKHGIYHQGCIWIWIHNVCKQFNMQCNSRISKFSCTWTWYGLSISNLVCTKWKRHTSLQTECMTLLMKTNSATTQIVSSHAGSCKEMKKRNYYIYLGIVIWNAPSFKY